MINKLRSFGIFALAGALLLGCSFSATAQSTSGAKVRSDDDREWYKYSIGVFGGVQFWKNETRTNNSIFSTVPLTPIFNVGNPDSFAPGGAAGIRADQDFWKYVGVEEAWTVYAVNNLRLVSVQPYPTQVNGFGARNGQVFIGPLFYLTPRGTRVRPFFTVGPALQYWWPTSDAHAQGLAGAAYGNPNLERRTGAALGFGGGVKFHLTERVSFRTDARGTWTTNPHFNVTAMPGGPGSVYIPQKGSQLGLQASIGLDWSWHKNEVAPPPAPPPPPPPPPAPGAINVSLSASPASVCPGESVQVTATTNAPDSASYQWTINGESTSQAKTLTFGTNGREAGNYNVGLTLSAPGFNTGTGSTSVTVRPYVPPSGSASASPSEIFAGDTSTITANFTNQCDGPVQPPVCTASEGTVSGMTYNSAGVQFDPSISGDQQKNVTITCTAKDDRSSGTATTSIVVKKKANLQAIRLPDIVFARNNARVNNCGKRVLLEELKTYLDRDPSGKVVLVGHIDAGELKKLRLDEHRALNAAAIVSAGKGICLSFNPSQIMVQSSGEDQGGADFKPYFCEASVQERGGSRVTAADKRAEYRRVEVWFVPTNGTMPASAGSAKDAGSLGVGKLGCPK
jgi:outer membrane protein OmpA-like peptidoglycan-associated protein